MGLPKSVRIDLTDSQHKRLDRSAKKRGQSARSLAKVLMLGALDLHIAEQKEKDSHEERFPLPGETARMFGQKP